MQAAKHANQAWEQYSQQLTAQSAELGAQLGQAQQEAASAWPRQRAAAVYGAGQDAAVGEHVAEDPGFDEFFGHLKALLGPLLPRYEQEGKSYLTIAVGCTGGRHRSVYVAERLGAWLSDRGEKARVRHRDLDKR